MVRFVLLKLPKISTQESVEAVTSGAHLRVDAPTDCGHESAQDLKPGECEGSQKLSFRREFLRRCDEFYAPSSTIWNVLNSKTNDEDELERHGCFKKSKTRVTKHDDQSKEHHLDHCEVDVWWFDPCLLCWSSGRVSARYHEKGRPGSHMKRVIAVQEEPSLHVNPTRERDVPD